MRPWYHGDARAELQDAAFWYEEMRPGLGTEFLETISSSIKRIGENPARYPVIYKQLRRALVPRFPYQIIFSFEQERLYIYAIIHLARDPRIWKSRLR